MTYKLDLEFFRQHTKARYRRLLQTLSYENT